MGPYTKRAKGHRHFSLGGTYTKTLPWLSKLLILMMLIDMTCIDGALTQTLFAGFQLSIMLIDMHWSDLKTKSFRRFFAINSTYGHALVGTLSQNRFANFQ